MSKLPNPIEEYFTDKGMRENTHYDELFRVDEKDNLDLMTEVDDDEIRAIATLHLNDQWFMSMGARPVFSDFFNKYMRLKVSRNRKSREEYVDVNKKAKEELQEQGMKQQLGVRL